MIVARGADKVAAIYAKVAHELILTDAATALVEILVIDFTTTSTFMVTTSGKGGSGLVFGRLTMMWNQQRLNPRSSDCTMCRYRHRD